MPNITVPVAPALLLSGLPPWVESSDPFPQIVVPISTELSLVGWIPELGKTDHRAIPVPECYPISLCLGELSFSDAASPVMEAEYKVLSSESVSWDFPDYQATVTSGHPMRHELPADHGLTEGHYHWRARLKDGNGVWSNPSRETDLFINTAPSTPGLDCGKIVTSAGLASMKLGEPEYAYYAPATKDMYRSSICLIAGTPGATSIPVEIYRTIIESDNTVSESLIGTVNLEYPAGSSIHEFAMDYKLSSGLLYILYIHTWKLTADADPIGQAAMARIEMTDPSTVAHTLMLIDDGKIFPEIALIRGGTQSTAIDLSCFISTGDSLVSFFVPHVGTAGYWVEGSTPTVPNLNDIPGNQSLRQDFTGLQNYSALAFKPLSTTEFRYVFGTGGTENLEIIHGLQESDPPGSALYLYTFHLTEGLMWTYTYTPEHTDEVPINPTIAPSIPGYIAGNGFDPFVMTVPQIDPDTLLAHVLVVHFEVSSGGVAQLLREQKILFKSQCQISPYVCTLLDLGNDKVLMTRSASGASYIEAQIYAMDKTTGVLTQEIHCANFPVNVEPGASPSGVAPLSLVATLHQPFYEGTKILVPVVSEPTGLYYRDFDYIHGALLDLTLPRSALPHREYGESQDTGSGTSLVAVGVKGNTGNDTVTIDIASDYTLKGLKITATFDRSQTNVWASAAWVYIQELNYTFPLIVGDEAHTPWPTTVTDLEVSLGEEFNHELTSGSTLTLELCLSRIFDAEAGYISYSSFSATTYGLETGGGGGACKAGTQSCSSALVTRYGKEVDSPSEFFDDVVVNPTSGYIYTCNGESILKYDSDLNLIAVSDTSTYDGPVRLAINHNNGNLYGITVKSNNVAIFKYPDSLASGSPLQVVKYYDYANNIGHFYGMCITVNQATGDVYAAASKTSGTPSGGFIVWRFSSDLSQLKDYEYVTKSTTEGWRDDFHGAAWIRVNESTNDVYVGGSNQDYDGIHMNIVRLSQDLSTVLSNAWSNSANNDIRTCARDAVIDSSGNLYVLSERNISDDYWGSPQDSPGFLLSKYSSTLTHITSKWVNTGFPDYNIIYGKMEWFPNGNLCALIGNTWLGGSNLINQLLTISPDFSTINGVSYIAASTTMELYGLGVHPTTGDTYVCGTYKSGLRYTGVLVKNLHTASAGATSTCNAGASVAAAPAPTEITSPAFSPATTGRTLTTPTLTETLTGTFSSVTPEQEDGPCELG